MGDIRSLTRTENECHHPEDQADRHDPAEQDPSGGEAEGHAQAAAGLLAPRDRPQNRPKMKTQSRKPASRLKAS